MKIKKIKNGKMVIYFFTAIILTIIFFTYSVIITHDSSHYLWLTSMLGNNKFCNWDIIRGFIFPMFIKISNVLFGSTTTGLKVGMYIAYCIMILMSYLIYRDSVGKENICGKKFKIATYIMFIFMIALNPIIFGYYHTLLTEFLAITISIVFCYLSWKWIFVDFFENKKMYCVYTLIFAIFTVIAWFLKQPYVGIVIFPIFVATIISIIKEFNCKNIIQRLLTVVICVIFMAVGIKTWNYILETNNVKMDESRNPSASFGDYLLNLCISELDRNTYNYTENNDSIFELEKGGYNYNEDIYLKQMEELTDESKEQIKNNKDKYKTFIIVDKKDGYDIVFNKKNSISFGNAIIYDLKYFLNHPTSVISKQFKNYLTICNIYKIIFKGSQGTIPCYSDEKLKLFESNENGIISYKIYNYKSENNLYLNEKFYPYAESYIEKNTPILLVNFIMQKWFKFMTMIIKVCLLLLPIIILIDIILMIKNRKKYNKNFKNITYLMLILYIYSFMHIIAHSFIGSIIDRYTNPAVITTFIAIYINIYILIYRKKYLEKFKNNNF